MRLWKCVVKEEGDEAGKVGQEVDGDRSKEKMRYG